MRRLPQGGRGVVAASLLCVAGFACGGTGTEPFQLRRYILQSVNGAGLPAPLASQVPPDSLYEVVIAQQIIFWSPTELEFSAYYGWAHVQAGAAPTYTLSVCWKHFKFAYAMRGDTAVSGASLDVVPQTPRVPPYFFFRDGGVVAPLDAAGAPNEYRYAPGPELSISCI